MSATVKGQEKETVEQLEQRIVEQEGAMLTMENRNYFSLYCLQMETQLIHANMDILVVMLKNLVEFQIKKLQDVSFKFITIIISWYALCFVTLTKMSKSEMEKLSG